VNGGAGGGRDGGVIPKARSTSSSAWRTVVHVRADAQPMPGGPAALPTEAEWNSAARADSCKSVSLWGDESSRAEGPDETSGRACFDE